MIAIHQPKYTNAIFAIKRMFISAYVFRIKSQTPNNHFQFFFYRFKTNAILRTHCNRQIDLKCEICSMVFCKEKALKIHKAEGCEGIIETGHILQNTPTFVDCSPILNIKIEEGHEMPLLSDTFTGETVAHYDETNVYKDIEKEAAGTSSSKRKVRSSDSNNCKRKYLSKKYQRTDGQNYCCHLCNKW